MNEKRHIGYLKSMFFVGLGILIVLFLANFNAVREPIKTFSSICFSLNLGLVLAYIINPIMRLFEKYVFKKIKQPMIVRILSLLCGVLILLIFVAGMLWLIIPSLTDSISDLIIKGPGYIENTVEMINKFKNSLPFQFNSESDITVGDVLSYITKFITETIPTIITGTFNAGRAVVDTVFDVLISMFVMIYVLLDKERLAAYAKRLLKALTLKKYDVFMKYITFAHKKFGGFFIGKIIDSAMIGVLTFVICKIFSIPYSALVATIIGVTNIIPVFGPIFGGVISCPIVFINNPMKGLLLALLILGIQQLDGHIIGPAILGDTTGISSFSVLVATIIFGGMFGFIGMVIGVPLTALILAVLDDTTTHRLIDHNLPTNLKEYESPDALIALPESQPEKISSFEKLKRKYQAKKDAKNIPQKSSELPPAEDDENEAAK